MSDDELITRLRERAQYGQELDPCTAYEAQLSADRIEVLESDLAALRIENQHLRQMARFENPTDTMEQLFAAHYRRGYDAGRFAALEADKK